jgi:hypothetical protein
MKACGDRGDPLTLVSDPCLVWAPLPVALSKNISDPRNAIASTFRKHTRSPDDMDDYEEAILFTFGELESRLDRLEYVLGGANALSEEKPQTIPDRIRRIEKSLQTLGAQTSLLGDAHELRMFGNLALL